MQRVSVCHAHTLRKSSCSSGVHSPCHWSCVQIGTRHMHCLRLRPDITGANVHDCDHARIEKADQAQRRITTKVTESTRTTPGSVWR